MGVQTSYTFNFKRGIEGQIADGCEDHEIVPMRNNEASAVIPFGTVVAFEGSTDDFGAIKIANTSAKCAGIVVHSHAYGVAPYGDLDQTTACGSLRTGGVKPGGNLNVMRKGRILVKPEVSVAPGDRLFVRADVDTNEN